VVPCDTVGVQFRKVVAQDPDRVALVDGEKSYTYRDLAGLSSAYTERLRDRLDLSPGQVLLGWLDNSPEFVAAFLAAGEMGAIFFPLNIHWRPPELRWFLDQLPIAGVVTTQALRAPWHALSDRISPARILAVDDPPARPLLRPAIDAGLPRHMATQVSPDQPVVYLSSSGTSGVPKIVPRSHRNTLEGAAGTARALGITAGLRFLSVVPFYHGNGLDNSMSLPLFTGGTAVLQHDFVPSRFAAAMSEHRVEVLVGSPAIFELLLRFGIDAGCLSPLRICASSGGPLARETADRIRRRFGVTIRQVYGASETGVIAIDPPEGGPPAVPVPTVSLRALDRSGQPLPAGEKGEIAVKGPAVVSGYVGESRDTAHLFSDGYYCTGDLGCLDSAGNLTLLGRIRAVINLSGTKVDPVEIENTLMTLPGVSACRVVGELAEQRTEIIKAVIAVREGATLSRADVIRHCRSLLAEYKIPRTVEFVPSLPADWTGKRAVSWGRIHG
jgi:acyl-coenzyme A synthetase/AMP-(fatty) acid ligase